MTAKIILNPYANRWQAGKRRDQAEEALRAAGVDYDLAITEYPGHGIELAAQAAREGFNPVIAAGGDSTLSFIYGFAPTRRRLLQLLPRMTKPAEGNITEAPEIQEVNSPWLRIHIEPSSPAHTDGEIFDFDTHDLEYRILPGKLPVLLP